MLQTENQIVPNGTSPAPAEVQTADQILDQTVTPTADAIEAVKTPNGVEFTPEELGSLDPALRNKILETKKGYANLQNTYQTVKAEKVAEVQPEAPKAEVKVEAPAPTTNKSVTELYILEQMSREKFRNAVARAHKFYGPAQVDKISRLVAGTAQQLVQEGRHDANFDGLMDAAFTKLMREDMDFVGSYQRYKSGINEAALKAQAVADANNNLLVAAANKPVVTGTPAGGAPVFQAPLEAEDKPRSFAEARIKAKEQLSAFYNAKD